MATEETALTPTSVTPAPSPAGEGASPAAPAAPAPVSTSADVSGGVDTAAVATAALDQATPALDEVLSAIPETDDDLSTVTDAAQRTTLTNLRGQLRVLGSAVRELQPLRDFKQYGDPAAVKPRLELARLLYSPLMRNGQVVRNPDTQTPYITTRPFVEYLDRVSPGMPEQLLADLLNFETDNPALIDPATGQPVVEPLINSVFRYHKLDPRRLADYQNIDTLIRTTSGAITPDELAEIDSKYHDAYRTIPAGIRAAWKSFDEAEQLRILEDYKGKLDDAAYKEEQRRAAEQRKAADQAAYQARVAEETDKYLNTVRRERTASMLQSLAQQVTFSTDPVSNKVMLGSLAATMAQLLDPAWRFVVIDEVLTPLGLKLDHTFDEALGKFDTSAANEVAFRMMGDQGQAQTAHDEMVSAANQLMAKLAIFAVKVAAKQGATVAEKAAVQATALAGAVVGRPGPGNGTAAAQQGILPPGMIPGTDEATRYIARQTGLFRDS